MTQEGAAGGAAGPLEAAGEGSDGAGVGWHPVLERELEGAMFFMLDMCSSHESQLLHVSLPAAGRALLKGLRSRYEQQHKYSGKV